MKNIITLLLLCACFQQVQAQNDDAAFEKSMVKTESTHIVDVGWVGVGYTYEYAFAEHYTISGGAGITGYAGYTSSDFFGNYWTYAFHPYVSIEPRYYYNLQKRVRKGKSIDGNTGSFLAVQGSYIFKPIKKHNVYGSVSTFAVAPYWGLRRIWWNHLLFEFRAGLAFGFNNYNDSNVGITLGIRLGYKF
ncbi:MAG: hypothetical protein LBT27_03100 [Prevotellaceae bacterium]|jgi:hypothetical protein|nr:hypothetical protein [Prevotellaceae bacterium]